MAYQNKHDKTGLNSSDGEIAEALFREIAIKKGYEVTEATKNQQFAHIDFLLEKDGKTWKIDCKSKKKLSRQDSNYNYEWTWIEFANVSGKPGWLYGEADYIVFQRELCFTFFQRNKLAEHCEALVDFESIVTRPKLAYRKIYQRFKRKDKISLLKFSELEQIPHSNWIINSNDV